ncbi:MAG: NYN domain-containing protein [Chloroflexia bacterium]|nr:NYN domain-containing protein [Chloroflexia bacterium]
MANYAFIDGQNLHSGIMQVGWRLDYRKLRGYLARQYQVTTSYYFLGYLESQERLYVYLRQCGYELRFKPVTKDAYGNVKGNVDAALVLQAMVDFAHYDRAVLVSGDGDYYSLVAHLRTENKLGAILSPNRGYCSTLLKKEARGRLWYIEDMRHLVEYT